MVGWVGPKDTKSRAPKRQIPKPQNILKMPGWQIYSASLHCALSFLSGAKSNTRCRELKKSQVSLLQPAERRAKHLHLLAPLLLLLAPIFGCSTTACSTITLLHTACSTATQAGAPPATESPSSTSRDASPPPYYSSSSSSSCSSCVTSMRMNHLRLLLLTTSNLFCSISCVLTLCVLSESSRGIAAGGFAEETIGGFLTHSTHSQPRATSSYCTRPKISTSNVTLFSQSSDSHSKGLS